MPALGPKDYLDLGNWNAICDVCGFKYKDTELRKRWDGLMVCPSDYEQRHPQDLIRSKPDKQAPLWARPEADDVFVTPAPADPSKL
jgi:hypothetical protein